MINHPSPIVRIERGYTPDLSPLKIGGFTVHRARLTGTNYTVYSIMHGDYVAGRQLSYPEPNDCAAHVSRFEHEARGVNERQQAALLDRHLHHSIVETLRTRELDARDLCRVFSKTSSVMAPVLKMLVAESRIQKIGTPRRPIYTAPAAQAA